LPVTSTAKPTDTVVLAELLGAAVDALVDPIVAPEGAAVVALEELEWDELLHAAAVTSRTALASTTKTRCLFTAIMTFPPRHQGCAHA
jgi:hypothetical protein